MEELFKQKFDSESEDEEYIPTAKELEDSAENKSKSKSDIKAQKSKVDAFWEKMKKKSSQNKTSLNYKIVLIGNSSVGKTALFRKIETGEFYDRNISTIGIRKKKK